MDEERHMAHRLPDYRVGDDRRRGERISEGRTAARFNGLGKLTALLSDECSRLYRFQSAEKGRGATGPRNPGEQSQRVHHFRSIEGSLLLSDLAGCKGAQRVRAER